jgi:uncharacterized protein YndB with AHSA1/START domain
MASARRTRTIAAAPHELWEVIGDPHHLPRWWPGVERVEGVSEAHFTEVHVSKRGRTVRIDYDVIESEPPLRRAWAQDLIGTPFERFLRESTIAIELEPGGAGTEVALLMRQLPRGTSRFGGGVLFSRAGRRILDDALAGLARLFE